MKKETLYSRCITLWGYPAQIDMAIEEMSELIKALCKSKRYSKPITWLSDVYDEIADVQIMLDQLVIIFEGEETVPEVIKRKLARLEETLNKTEGEK